MKQKGSPGSLGSRRIFSIQTCSERSTGESEAEEIVEADAALEKYKAFGAACGRLRCTFFKHIEALAVQLLINHQFTVAGDSPSNMIKYGGLSMWI